MKAFLALNNTIIADIIEIKIGIAYPAIIQYLSLNLLKLNMVVTRYNHQTSIANNGPIAQQLKSENREKSGAGSHLTCHGIGSRTATLLRRSQLLPTLLNLTDSKHCLKLQPI